MKRWNKARAMLLMLEDFNSRYYIVVDSFEIVSNSVTKQGPPLFGLYPNGLMDP